MNGMVQNEMMKGAPEEMPEESPVPGGAEQATPEEQEQLERVTYAAMDVMHDPQTNPQIMRVLQKGGEDPSQALVDVTEIVMLALMDQAEKSGSEIPPEILMPAAAEVMGMAAELGQRSGAFEVTEQVQAVAAQKLWARAMELLEIDPAEAEAFLAEIPEEEKMAIVQQQEQYAMGGVA